MLIKDEFLSRYFFPKPVYKYVFPFEETKAEGFTYAKISIDDLSFLENLLVQGFFLIETSLLFTQQRVPNIAPPDRGFIFRPAKNGDKKQVLAIAEKAFQQARFYKDPLIETEKASAIKRGWAENFFKKQRGTEMLVCQTSKGGIAGFLLLIDNIIDLIATSEDYLHLGVGSGLILSANKNVGVLKAGTQSTNFRSIRLYKKLHFHIEKAYFLLHKHIK